MTDLLILETGRGHWYTIQVIPSGDNHVFGTLFLDGKKIGRPTGGRTEAELVNKLLPVAKLHAENNNL